MLTEPEIRTRLEWMRGELSELLSDLRELTRHRHGDPEDVAMTREGLTYTQAQIQALTWVLGEPRTH